MSGTGDGAGGASRMKEAGDPSLPRPVYRWRVLRAGRLLLDGGGMFGMIPKVVWSRSVPVDEQNRIELHHNCVLLERDGEDGGVVRYLIEAGSGDKLGEKMRAIYGFDGRTVEAALVEAGVEVGSVSSAIVSHLHFDHAGGLTRRCREGETSDWIATKPGSASGDSPEIRLTLPDAEVVVQRREWVDARANDSVMTKTYYRDHLLPFEDDALALPGGRPRLRLVDSPRPFPLNRKPGRDELPRTRLEDRETEVLPGVWVFLVPGHTWGQQAVRWRDGAGRDVVFAADLIPTRHHAGAAYSLAYDVEAYTTMVTKRWFLMEAAERGWLLVLDHEPGEPLFRVRAADGWFELVPEEGSGG